jgi:AcrR family transcriptional regulator
VTVAAAGTELATRAALMAAGERLFAEHGLGAVSNRQIAEAAGRRNVTAVSYHFGGRTGLLRAIMTEHGERVDRIRERHVRAVGDSSALRDWVGCLVRPVPEHLAELGSPSWNARFSVQVMADPALRSLVTEEALSRPWLRRVLDGLHHCLAELPADVRQVRGEMGRHLITQICAERERALAEGGSDRHGSWERTADALTDAITGLLTAPVTPRA